MLRPSKHTHPDRTVLSVATLLLVQLRAERLTTFDKLRRLARKRAVGGDVLFLPAVNLLFLLGLI